MQTSNLNVPHVKDEIKRLIQRYIDRMKKHLDILAKERNQNNTPIKKKITPLGIYSSKLL